MDKKHQNIIKANYASLVERTDLDSLVRALLEKNVFSSQMIEPYLDTSKEARSRKNMLYIDILRRGPDAFKKLVDALFDIGHWDLVKLIDPENSLLGGNNKMHSIKDERINSTQFNRANLIGESSYHNSVSSAVPSYFDEEEKPIKVIKSLNFGQSSNPDLTCYNMRSKKRGILFMINNVQFDNGNLHQYRKGALKDQDNLEKLFTQIGFHKIIIHNNLIAKDMNDKLQEFAESEILERTNCVFVVVASHGKEDKTGTYINGRDGECISINTILKKFNSPNCPLLHQVPKIFVFQICRGDSSDYGSKSHTQPDFRSRIQQDGICEENKMRTYCDMLIAHSTVPGFSSHRDIIFGSWYFFSLCQIFMKHAHDTHLEDLFKLVDNRLKTINLTVDTLQTSSFENWGFNRHCFLNPGLFEE